MLTLAASACVLGLPGIPGLPGGSTSTSTSSTSTSSTSTSSSSTTSSSTSTTAPTTTTTVIGACEQTEAEPNGNPPTQVDVITSLPKIMCFTGNGSGDTDWFKITVLTQRNVSFRCDKSVPFGVLLASNMGNVLSNTCTTTTFTSNFLAGDYYVHVSPADGASYRMRIA
jgi:hypothetical protein